MKLRQFTPLLLVLLVACSGTPASSPSPSTPASNGSGPTGWEVTQEVWVLTEGKQADPSDSTLTIEVLGGGCHHDVEKLDHVDVEETDQQVRISAFVTQPQTTPNQPCEAPIVAHEAQVELDRPLGERDLVDTACVGEEKSALCSERDET